MGRPMLSESFSRLLSEVEVELAADTAQNTSHSRQTDCMSDVPATALWRLCKHWSPRRGIHKECH
eukprot:2530494-Amphidinium_carterae.1